MEFYMIKNKNTQGFNEEEAEKFVHDKQPEFYDTVKDEIVGNKAENVQADYEGVLEEELDDEPPL